MITEEKLKLPNLPNIIVEDITTLTKDEWLGIRNSANNGESIGGSTIASLMGCGYESPLDIYNRIKGIQMTPREMPEEIVALGVKYEAEIASKYATLSRSTLIETKRMYQSSTYPFMIGDFDYFQVTSKNEVAGLEIKYTDSNNKALLDQIKWEKKPPQHYEYQCRWYMAITGLPKWVLAIGWKQGNVSTEITDVAYVVVERDLSIEATMIQVASDFLNDTRKCIQPKISFSSDIDKLLDAVKRSYEDKFGEVELLDTSNQLALCLIQFRSVQKLVDELAAESKPLEEELELYKTQILQSLQGHVSGVLDTTFGTFTISRKTRNKTILNLEEIKKHFPNEYKKACIFNESAFKKSNPDLLSEVARKEIKASYEIDIKFTEKQEAKGA